MNDSNYLQVQNPYQKMISENLRKRETIKVTTSSSSMVNDGVEEPDPELLDHYDNFYQTTKSLLVLFQIMGIMPIERGAKGKTTFKYVFSTLGFTTNYLFF